VNVVLEVGQRLFAAFALGLGFEQENGHRPKQGQIARRGAVAHRATVLILGAVSPIVLPIFDAPVLARQPQQSLGPGLFRPKGSHRKANVVTFLNDLALAYLLGVAVDARDLSNPGQADRLGVGGRGP